MSTNGMGGFSASLHAAASLILLWPFWMFMWWGFSLFPEEMSAQEFSEAIVWQAICALLISLLPILHHVFIAPTLVANCSSSVPRVIHIVAWVFLAGWGPFGVLAQIGKIGFFLLGWWHLKDGKEAGRGS